MLLAGGCSAPPAVVLPLEVDEVEVGREDVPPAAMDTLDRVAGGRPFTALEREGRGRLVAYEGEWQDGGVEAEATVLADGGLLETERELTLAAFAELPPAVRERVRRLEAEGYEVEVALRLLHVFDVDYRRGPAAAPDTEGELLLRPDGSDATRRP